MAVKCRRKIRAEGCPGSFRKRKEGIRIGRVRNRDGREDIRAQFGSADRKHRDRRAPDLEAYTPETDRDGTLGEDFVRLVIELDFERDVANDLNVRDGCARRPLQSGGDNYRGAT